MDDCEEKLDGLETGLKGNNLWTLDMTEDLGGEDATIVLQKCPQASSS